MPRSVSRSASLTRDHTSEAHDDDATGSNDNKRVRHAERDQKQDLSPRDQASVRDHIQSTTEITVEPNGDIITKRNKNRKNDSTGGPNLLQQAALPLPHPVSQPLLTVILTLTAVANLKILIRTLTSHSSLLLVPKLGLISQKKKLIKRIRNNTFIDFSDLLPLQQSSAPHADELELSVDSKNNPCFIKKQSNKSLSFLMWSEAYDIFQLIYIETHITT